MKRKSSTFLFAACAGLAMIGTQASRVAAWQDVTAEDQHPREIARFNHAERPAALAFSPDGRLLATAGYERAIRVWDLQTKKERRRFEVPYGAVWGLAFAPSGKQLAVGHYRDYRTYLGVARLLDLESGKETAGWVAHKENVYFVAYSPDGSRLFTAGRDRTLRIRDLANDKDLHSFPGPEKGWNDFALSADGKFLAVQCYGEDSGPNERVKPSLLRLWDAQTGKEIRKIPLLDRDYRSFAFAPDFKTFAIVDRNDSIRLIDSASAAEIGRLDTDRVNRCISTLRFSPDGKTLVSSEHVTELVVWDVAAAKVRRTLTGHAAAIHALAFSSDSGRLASASDDLSARVWDLK